MEIRKMSDGEIAEELRKAGGYSNYREQTLRDPELPESRSVTKSAVEVSTDYYTAVAKTLGVSLETFFKENPKHYEAYRELFRK